MLHATLLDHVATCWAGLAKRTQHCATWWPNARNMLGAAILTRCCTNMFYPFGQGFSCQNALKNSFVVSNSGITPLCWSLTGRDKTPVRLPGASEFLCGASRPPWQLARRANEVDPKTIKMYTFSDFTPRYFEKTSAFCHSRQGKNGTQKKETRKSNNKLRASGPKPQLAPRDKLSAQIVWLPFQEGKAIQNSTDARLRVLWKHPGWRRSQATRSTKTPRKGEERTRARGEGTRQWRTLRAGDARYGWDYEWWMRDGWPRGKSINGRPFHGQSCREGRAHENWEESKETAPLQSQQEIEKVG